MERMQALATNLQVEKHYKENALVQRCTHLKKCADYLIEQIENQCTNGLYIGEIIAETREIEKTFYELQSVEGKLMMLDYLKKEQE